MASADRPGQNTEADPRVGLCARCQHGREVVSSRQATFWRCELADRDRSFAKYPVLPVVRCPGYAAKTS